MRHSLVPVAAVLLCLAAPVAWVGSLGTEQRGGAERHVLVRVAAADIGGRPRGASTTGMIGGRVAVADWGGDGLPDLLVGGARGQVLWYPNRGTRARPEFPHARLVFTADGKPLDVGFSAAPLAVDWDGDGV